MKIALIILGILVGLLVLTGLLLYLLGRAQPERHTSRVSFAVPKPRAAVWAALTDYASMPQWWPAVKSIRFETRSDGTQLTINTDKHGQQIAFRTKEEQAPARLVREIVGDELPFGGTWTYELANENGATRLTVTEDGFIKPPLFRAIARYFLGLDTTLKDFAQHFTAHLAAK